MPTLREILIAHSPVLVLDAASSQVQIGWLEFETATATPTPRMSARWEQSADEATTAVFAGLSRLGRNPGDANAFVFCDGPGSVLGIRTVAMAIRTWNVLRPRPVFAYCSLALVAHTLGRSDTSVIADARRDTWHHYQIGRGLRRVPASELSGELVMPENFRHWSALPANVTRVPYFVAELLPRTVDADQFQPTDNPDAFLHEEPNYVAWTPQIHRAPGERI
ncbi:MAG: peptidase M22 [Opitutaceae bacterium]|nr:peptidase M22 [Opitutaceae bacterium]